MVGSDGTEQLARLLHDFIESGPQSADFRLWPPEIAVIAGQEQCVVAIIGVNGERVDATVHARDREWRVVFGTSDGHTIDWISAFERPTPFTGVDGGRAVVFNGASGSGKSSAMRAMLDLGRVPWVMFDEPVLGEVARSYLIWRETAAPLHRGFLDGIAALARAGNCVVMSAAGMPIDHFDRALTGVPHLYVGLHCDLPTLLERERGREGRWGGLAEASLNSLDGWTHDLTFDTATVSAADIAAQVLTAVEALAL